MYCLSSPYLVYSVIISCLYQRAWQHESVFFKTGKRRASTSTFMPAGTWRAAARCGAYALAASSLAICARVTRAALSLWAPQRKERRAAPRHAALDSRLMLRSITSTYRRCRLDGRGMRLCRRRPTRVARGRSRVHAAYAAQYRILDIHIDSVAVCAAFAENGDMAGRLLSKQQGGRREKKTHHSIFSILWDGRIGGDKLKEHGLPQHAFNIASQL